MAKWRCRLCGGKLVNNRCTFCGLDNSIYDKDHNYHHKFNQQLRREKAAEHAKPELIARPVKASKKQPASSDTVVPVPEKKSSSSASSFRRNTSASSRQKGKERILLIIVIVIIVFLAFSVLSRLFVGFVNQMETPLTTSDEYTYEDLNSSYPRDIPESGTNYETLLGCGFYKIGIHIPEGIYHAELVDGSGTVQINDDINSIYTSDYFGTDNENGEITEAEDLLMYTGAELFVDTGVLVRFTTSNAQPLTDTPVSNPLTETISLPAGSYTAGAADIPEGIYDLEISNDNIYESEDYASLVLTYPNGKTEYLWVEGTQYSVSSEGISSKGIKNVVITNQTRLDIEGGTVLLIPSSGYYNIDYSDYISN